MTNRRNLAIYRLYAPVYDAVMRPLMNSARRRAIDHLQLQAGERVLISGTGTGLDLPLIPADVLITAIDLSPAMLDRARPAAAGETIRRDTRLRLGQAYSQRQYRTHDQRHNRQQPRVFQVNLLEKSVPRLD